MNLPEISLPFLEGISGVSPLLHPVVVHFAIVLPVFVLIFELVNVVFKRRSLGIFSFVLFILTGAFIATAYITGTTDGKEAWEFLTPEGQEALKAHKILGSYLTVGFGLLLFFKLATLISSHLVVRMVYLIFLVAFLALLLKQGKDGGSLVFTHGANVEQVKILDDKLFKLEYEFEDLQERCNKLNQTEIDDTNTTDETQTQEAPISLNTIDENLTKVAPANLNTTDENLTLELPAEVNKIEENLTQEVQADINITL